MGYPRLFAVNVTISGSLQPLLVPPSHNMIIYSIAAGGTVSVAHLFMGGIIPALLLGLSLVILVSSSRTANNFPKGERSSAPSSRQDRARRGLGHGHDRHHSRRHSVRRLHADGIRRRCACVYAFLVTMFVYRDVKWSELPNLIGRVIRTVGMVMIMIGFSIAFGYMMALLTGAGDRDEVLHRHFERQVYVPALDQHSVCCCSARSWIWRRCS